MNDLGVFIVGVGVGVAIWAGFLELRWGDEAPWNHEGPPCSPDSGERRALREDITEAVQALDQGLELDAAAALHRALRTLR